MLAKCISTDCDKSSLCNRALSNSTAHIDYKRAVCDESNEYKWYVEIEFSQFKSDNDFMDREDVKDENSEEG